MKFIFKKLLQSYLKFLTKIILLLHRPIIIAIAGSTNKTFAREKIVAILKEKNLSVRSNPKSFNTEIGLPLSVLNLPSGYNSYKNWLPIIIKAMATIFDANFPKIMVLELGVDRPGDMKFLLSMIKPKIVILTDITQRYLESFTDMNELVGEYKYLITKIGSDGLVILNYDNLRIRKIAEKTLAKVFFFSLNKNDVTLPDFWSASDIITDKNGQQIKVIHDSTEKIYKINRFGLHHVYVLLIGLIVKNNLEKIIN